MWSPTGVFPLSSEQIVGRGYVKIIYERNHKKTEFTVLTIAVRIMQDKVQLASQTRNDKGHLQLGL